MQFNIIEDNDQYAYAERIEKEVLAKIKHLPKTSKIYQPDRLKKNNDGSFYTFEVDKYRISYRNLPQEIRILRIRHSSRRPYTR